MVLQDPDSSLCNSSHSHLSSSTLDGSSHPAVTEPSKDSESSTKQKPAVVIPNLFSSIMAVKPLVNPHYHDVKKKAEAWFSKVIQADEKWAQRISQIDLCYLASMWAPGCDKEALRIMVDWLHWILLFDDQFDEGCFSHDLLAARAEVKITMAIMDHIKPEPFIAASENHIRHIFQHTWYHIKERSSRHTQNRWRDTHRQYFDALLDQVQIQSEGRALTRDVKGYMTMRRGTIGTYPAIALTEFALGIDLLSEFFSHPSVQECMCVAADLVALVNDIVSYKKDSRLGVDHNLVNLLTHQGRSVQQAFDCIADMLDQCYRRWDKALADLPPYSDHTDMQALKFIELCRNMALGNLHWR